jgi:hypothetical protein
MSIVKPHIFEKINFFQINSPLLSYRSNIASQRGEDGVIQRIFEILPPPIQLREARKFVEFGAWDGKYLSNCFNLAEHFSWEGIFIEGNQEKFKDLIATHGNNTKLKLINKFVEIFGESTLDQILLDASFPKHFDLLSIDIDGTDYFVWESLQEFRPLVVVIEFNPTIPNDVVFVQEKNASINQGCSLSALVRLGKAKGYELICCTEWNAFFVVREHYGLFGIPNNHVSSLYVPVTDGRIFHGYDGTVHVIGMPSLLWHGLSLEFEDHQVLPVGMRKFGDSQSR